MADAVGYVQRIKDQGETVELRIRISKRYFKEVHLGAISLSWLSPVDYEKDRRLL